MVAKYLLKSYILYVVYTTRASAERQRIKTNFQGGEGNE